MERRLALGQAAWIKAIERPETGLHRELLLRHPLGHVEAMRDALAIRDDE